MVLSLALAAYASDPLWVAARSLGDDPREAAERLDAIAAFLPACTRGLTVDVASVDLARRLRDDLVTLDLSTLFAALPEAAGPSRRVRASGVWAPPGAYRLTLFPTEPAARPADLGTWTSTTALTPWAVERGRSFAVRHDQTLGLGGVRADQALAVLVGATRRLTDRLGDAPDPGALAAARAAFAEVDDPAALNLLAAFAEAAPHTVEALAEAVVIERVGRLRPDPAGDLLEIDALARARDLPGRPALDRYLDRLGPLLVGRAVLRDDGGRCVAAGSIDTSSMAFGLELTLRDGRLAPTSCRTGAPTGPVVPDTIAGLSAVRLELELEGVLRWQGVAVEMTGFEAPIELRPGPDDGLVVRLGVQEAPARIEVLGSTAWTGWAIGLADHALDLAGHAEVLFEGLAAGTEGQGSWIDVGWSGGPAPVLTSTADARVHDTVFVRFAFQVVGGALTPSDAVVAEARDLLGDLADAFAADAAAARGDVAAG